MTCVSHGMGINTSGLWRTNDPFGTQSSPTFPSRVTMSSNVAVVRSNMNSNKSILGSVNERPTNASRELTSHSGTYYIRNNE
jgi:hypothetical protein